jgi:CrcB protein
MNWIAVAVGAVLGSWLRWGLSVAMTAVTSTLPLGTLIVNLGGGYMIGIAFAFFHHHASLSPEWRLFVITGFLGGLTTFSTFSAESMVFLHRGDYTWALLHSALHLVGSIACCIAGYATYRALSG